MKNHFINQKNYRKHTNNSNVLLHRGVYVSNFIFIWIYIFIISVIFFRENELLGITIGFILIYFSSLGLKDVIFFTDHLKIIYITRFPYFKRYKTICYTDLHSAEFLNGAARFSPQLICVTKNNKIYRIEFYSEIKHLVELFKILNGLGILTKAKLRDENKIELFKKEIPETSIKIF